MKRPHCNQERNPCPPIGAKDCCGVFTVVRRTLRTAAMRDNRWSVRDMVRACVAANIVTRDDAPRAELAIIRVYEAAGFDYVLGGR